jgi:hypothetical protein
MLRNGIYFFKRTVVPQPHCTVRAGSRYAASDEAR